ncbi:hypothetical protein GZ998_05445 [Actinomyces sp. 594]|nr:hypothetical protein [Actinomyces sp. 594]MBW3068957.1 hypothetical protein [Actinomyces sp. 594]
MRLHDPDKDKQVEDWASSRRGGVVIAVITVLTGLILVAQVIVEVLR